MRTRAPVAGTWPPSHVVGADHEPPRAERITEVAFGGMALARSAWHVKQPRHSAARVNRESVGMAAPGPASKLELRVRRDVSIRYTARTRVSQREKPPK